MSSCQGELANTTLHVKAVGQDGAELLNEDIRTMANGFLELWLPRNQNVQVTIQGSGKQAVGTVETFLRSKTCITNFQLK